MARSSKTLPRGIDRVANGNYRVRIYYEDKQHVIGTFTTLGDAKAAHSIALSEKARGVFVSPGAKRKQRRAEKAAADAAAQLDARTVEDLAEAWLGWLERLDRKRNTIYQYQRHLAAYFTPTFAGRAVASITANEIETWFDQLSRDKGDTVAKPAYATVSSMFRYAAGLSRGLPRSFDRWIKESPCDIPGAARKAKGSTLEQPVATPEEIAAIADGMPPGENLIVLIGGWCGLRLGEILALRRKHITTTQIDGEQQAWIHVERQIQARGSGVREETPKSAAGIRQVPVPSQLAAHITEHLEQLSTPGPDALLFPRASSGNQIHNPNTVRRRFNTARDAVNAADERTPPHLEGFTFHGLRHSCLTRIGQAGATLADLMAYAGHSDVSSVLIYQHSERHRLASLSRQLSNTITLTAYP